MAQAHTQETGHDAAPAGVGWRLFQIAGLVTALTWLVSYVVFLDGYRAMIQIFGFENPLWIVGGIGYGLSPIVSLVLIAIAIWPRALAVLQGGGLPALGARAILFVVPAMWLGSVFVGNSAMITTMLEAPLGHSTALPVFGGAFVHVVFQHWFQGFAAIALALVPSRFSTLTQSSKPAGIQCAVVECG